MNNAGKMGTVKERSRRTDRVRVGDGHTRASVPEDAMPAGVFKGVQDDWLGRGREDRQAEPGDIKAGGPQAITTTEVILPLLLHPAPHLLPEPLSQVTG